MPPETSSDEPVMLPAFGEARNAAASPISAALDSLPSGTFFQRRCFVSSGSVSQRSVWMYPGTTQLTRIWYSANSTADRSGQALDAALRSDIGGAVGQRGGRCSSRC